MIDSAAGQCDELVVFVNSSPVRDTAPGDLRAAWLAELHPDVTVVEVRHELPTDFDDPELWERWMALFRERWPLDDGPHVVFSSDPYVDELAERFGAEAVVVDADRATVPISATQIRAAPGDHLDQLAPVVRAWVEANWRLTRTENAWNRTLSARSRRSTIGRPGCGWSGDRDDYLFGWGVTRRYGFTGFQPCGEQLLGLVVGHGRHDDDVLAVLPVGRRGDLVAGGELQAVDHAQDLVEVATGRGRVGDRELDLLVGPITKTERTVMVSLAFGWIMS